MKSDTCESCGKRPAEISFSYSRRLCCSCFLSLLERRCRKDLSDSGALGIASRNAHRSGRIYLLSENRLEGVAALHFLRRANPKLKVELFSVNSFSIPELLNFSKGDDALSFALAWSIEREDSLFLANYLSDKKRKNSVPLGQSFNLGRTFFFKVFRNARVEELRAYLKCLGVGKIPRLRADWLESKEYSMLTRLEARYPEIKFSLLSSSDFIRNGPKVFRKKTGKTD
jgi:hypothetical protein